MKKIIALVLCVLVICTLSVSAFADSKSPAGKEKVEITIRACDGENGITEDKPFEFNVDNAEVTVKASKNRGTFNGWALYKKVDGKTEAAVEGVDYVVLSGNVTSEQLKIKALNDLVICANYNGVITDPSVPSSGGSPMTADASVVFFAIAMIAAAAIVFSTKKVISK